MKMFRLIFPGDAPAIDLQADRMASSGNGVRLYRGTGADEHEIAYFRDGSYVACFEMPSDG